MKFALIKPYSCSVSCNKSNKYDHDLIASNINCEFHLNEVELCLCYHKYDIDLKNFFQIYFNFIYANKTLTSGIKMTLEKIKKYDANLLRIKCYSLIINQ